MSEPTPVSTTSEQTDVSEYLRAHEREARRFQHVLSELSVLNREDMRSVFAVIAQAGSLALSVRRVSLWRYDRSRSVMICPAAWQDGELIDEELVISRESCPLYWNALHSGRTLPVSDAVRDPAMVEIQKGYVQKYGIGAMLDSGIRVERGTFGIVCMEHIGTKRQWTVLEEQFVASLADRLGLAILFEEQRNLETQLQQAKKMEALGVMAGGVSHDFNNILNIVLAATDAAQANMAAGKDATEDLESIEHAVLRAAALTRKLLYISKNDSLGREKLDLNEAVRGFVSSTKRILPENVNFTFLPSSEALPLHAERTFIDQSLMNLVTNALYAMPQGGSLTIATRITTISGSGLTHGITIREGTYAHLRVLDTGSGIPADALPRIFEPFFTTKGVAGTGLGLAVVYGGIRQHGGYVSAESVVGRGTVFHLFFPLDN
jgi:two-component system, cell cycle sensor histidine kinase and response regulator CckA